MPVRQATALAAITPDERFILFQLSSRLWAASTALHVCLMQLAALLLQMPGLPTIRTKVLGCRHSHSCLLDAAERLYGADF